MLGDYETVEDDLMSSSKISSALGEKDEEL